MGLTRLGILSLLVGDDDHAANLCMGGLCGQNQWAALWAKPVFCYLWVCLWAASQLASCCTLCTDVRGPHLASCEALPEKWSSGCGHFVWAADLRPLCVGSRPWQNAKRTAHLRRIFGYQARVAHLRSGNICQLLLQPNTHQHQHQGIMNTFT